MFIVYDRDDVRGDCVEDSEVVICDIDGERGLQFEGVARIEAEYYHLVSRCLNVEVIAASVGQYAEVAERLAEGLRDVDDREVVLGSCLHGEEVLAECDAGHGACVTSVEETYE